MVLNMKATGRMIYSMVRARKSGRTAPATMDHTKKDLSMVKENTNGMMVQDTMVNGVIIRSMAMEFMFGQMEDAMKAIGRTIIWKAKEFMHGKMDADMRENIKMIRSMDLVYIHGPMGANTMACGLMESNTERASIFFLQVYRDVVNGKMDIEFAGLTASLKLIVKEMHPQCHLPE